jgi:hypothetical protein
LTGSHATGQPAQLADQALQELRGLLLALFSSTGGAIVISRLTGLRA